ncbi:MAG: glycosyltransferase [Nitrososphaerota archaeon]|nr:glycosyltransferase [Nitrososphaerota archaeon]
MGSAVEEDYDVSKRREVSSGMDVKGISEERYKSQFEYLGSDKEVNRVAPVVSVTVITYQHKAYISQCLDGILAQKTQFPFEVVIGEDGSSDGTREICIDYAEKHPDKIRLFLRDRKLTQLNDEERESVAQFNGVWTRMSARGKYVALCDGDDYWVDSSKLQRQVDFLEANQDFAMCFHKVKISKRGRMVRDYITDIPAQVTTIEDLIEWGNYIQTPSVMYRNDLIKEFPEWYYRSPVGDFPLHLLNALHGKIMYIDREMAVYRVHKGGVWSQRNGNAIELTKKWVAMFEGFEAGLTGELKRRVAGAISLTYLDLSDLYRNNGERELSLEAFKKSSEKEIRALYERYYRVKICYDAIKKFLNTGDEKFLLLKRITRYAIRTVRRALVS